MIRNLFPDEQLDSVYDLDLERLWTRGVRGIIFDLDNTLGPWGFERLDESALRWLQTIKERGFRLGFLSNHGGNGREELFESLNGHPVVFNAGKPRRAGYRRVLERLKLSPREVIMVGDQLFTDIWGAKRLGLHTILVQPVAPEREGPLVGFRRWLERVLLRRRSVPR
jgi:HAD superfamily phosphatase (TIGR01668 family)